LIVLVSHAQFKVGGNIGVPLNDSDSYKVSLGLDLYYMIESESDGLISFGPTLGLLYYGDDPGGGGDIKDAAFIPIAVAARIKLLDLIHVGPDLGYAVALDDLAIFASKNGGFYYRLVAGVDLFNRFEVNLFYHNVSIDANFSSIGLGVLYNF